MMRVLHVISGLDAKIGGTVSALIGLVEAQAAEGIEVAVASTYRRGEDLALADRLNDGGIETTTAGPGIGPWLWHPSIRRILEHGIERADVVHVHALWEEIQHRAAALSRRRGRPHVITPHGMLDPWGRTRSRLRKMAYLTWRLRRDLDRATALHYTADAERRLTEPMGLKAPTIVEPNGLDLSEFADLPEPGTFRARHREIGDRPIVMFLSRVHPKKGLDLLVPAFAALVSSDAVLVVAGPGDPDYVAGIESLARTNGIGDRVVFTGMMPERRRIESLLEADLFVLPSYQENFGIVVAEALACRTAVVVSDRVNICDDVLKASAGAVVPMNVKSLSETIGTWLTDPSRRREAGDRGREFVTRHYDWKLIASRWKRHYRRMING